jgi:DTW domain-containing protein YfiP
VRLPAGPPSRYVLRAHPDAGCLATLEAVARALGILEGAEVRRRLEELLDRFVQRTLWARGRLRSIHVAGGVPHRHPGPGR